jgi:hypothetical protein
VSKDGFVDWDHDAALASANRKNIFTPFLKRHDPNRGRKWDHLRTADPVIVASYAQTSHQPAQAWRDFVHSSSYGHMPGEESEVVDVETLNKLQPTFNKEMDILQYPLDQKASRRRRTVALYKQVWKIAVHHPFSPLAFRLIVMITSLIALAIAARMFEYENGFRNESAERSQAIVAIAVDTVAIPYIGYMLWDEYTGKPLGLRPPVQKISLILMDLFFIILKSASTALAFEALVYHNAEEGLVRHLSKSLASFMLVGLISWTMTFIVNVFRTVERLGGGEDEGVHM